ncbi:MAG: hypothetical protein NTX00_03870 [Candidatus Parcubacteria bacterium]|nr:hypothetical protein [Candidatus Parcubacteria bacterium]
MIFYNISKFFEHPYREDLFVKINFIFSLLLNLVIWFILYWKLHPLSYSAETDYGQIYLHYNIYFGIDNIGSWYGAFIIPILGLFIILFNNLLAYIFYVREKLLSYVLIFTQSFLQIVLFAAAIFLILLNI